MFSVFSWRPPSWRHGPAFQTAVRSSEWDRTPQMPSDQLSLCNTLTQPVHPLLQIEGVTGRQCWKPEHSTWPGIEEPIHSDIWRPWCRVYSQSLLVHRASEVDYSCRQLSDRTSNFAGWAEQMLAWPGRADPNARLTHPRAARCNNRSWTESKPGSERGTSQPRGIV